MSSHPPHCRQVRLFRTGRSQTVRIPREFELTTDEVVIYSEGNRLVIEPIPRARSLAEVLSTMETLEEEFPPIDDPPPTPERLL